MTTETAQILDPETDNQEVRDSLPSEGDKINFPKKPSYDIKDPGVRDVTSSPPVSSDTAPDLSEGDAEPGAAAEPGVDDNLVAVARSLGVPQEQLDKFGSSEQLRGFLEAKAQDMRRPPTEVPVSQPEPLPDRSFQIDLENLSGKSEDHEPAVVKMNEGLRKFVDHTNQRVSEIETLMGQMYQALQVQGRTASQGDADVYFSSDPSHKDLFGEGPEAGLDASGTQFQNRQKVKSYVDRQRAGYKAMGTDAPAFAAMATEGAGALFANHLKKTAVEGVAQKVRKRAAQQISDPGPKVPDTAMDKRRQAIKNAAKKMRAIGIIP